MDSNADGDFNPEKQIQNTDTGERRWQKEPTSQNLQHDELGMICLAIALV